MPGALPDPEPAARPFRRPGGRRPQGRARAGRRSGRLTSCAARIGSMERLFELEDGPRGRTKVPGADQPLAARMRPTSLGEFVGQEHLLERGSALRTALEEGRPHSMILYGPPGSGKTTLARILATGARAAFEEASAVSAGRQEVRDVLERAQHRRSTNGEPTGFFLDEIHRFNKPHQDTLLPAVGEGLHFPMMADTETPFFECNPALR